MLIGEKKALVYSTRAFSLLGKENYSFSGAASSTLRVGIT